MSSRNPKSLEKRFRTRPVHITEYREEIATFEYGNKTISFCQLLKSVHKDGNITEYNYAISLPHVGMDLPQGVVLLTENGCVLPIGLVSKNLMGALRTAPNILLWRILAAFTQM